MLYDIKLIVEKLNVHSIYKAIEGEGVNIGCPQVFVRLQGCSIGCINCDSRETWEFNENNLLTSSQIIDGIKSEAEHISRVSITGGDPLHQSHIAGVLELSRELKNRGYYINIEASGTRIVEDIFRVVDFISFDFKTPSTGVKTSRKLLTKLVSEYSGKFQIKSVIADKKDFDASYEAFKEINDGSEFSWVLTPCYDPNESFDLNLVHEIYEWNHGIGGVFRVIGQQHKWFYGVDSLRV